MAEAFVSVLLDRLASITLNKVGRELVIVVGVDHEVANLSRNLEAISAVLEDAEERQVKEAGVKLWLDNLKQVSYEMDNVLDEWSTEILKQQIEKQDGLVTDEVSFSSCFCFGKMNRVVHRRDIALKIENLNERLTLIANEKQSYNFQYTKRGLEQLERRPKTSSLLDISFGREKENNILVRRLLSESTSREEGAPLIIPIVGMGGIGKTTLSQHVYNDEMVRVHFDKRIWVCVSDPFDEIKIAKAIVEGLGDYSTPNSVELQTFVQRIYALIEEKKFLLVLDDVWNPNYSQWEQLIKPLRNGALGSRILVTTRNEEVANMMGATTHMINLKELSEEYCRKLFYHFASIDRERNKFTMFEGIGNDIVKKCKGLPLAAKTLGCLMRRKKTLREWQSVLNSKIWEVKEFEQQVFQPLLFSYYDLTSTIRRCLLCCAIFPKDYVIHEDNLIKLWMSQDYLNVKGNKEDKEITGQTYFEDLVMRSFFQDFKEDDDGNIESCKMHDIIHDFVQFLTKNECFTMELNGANERMELRGDKVLHLTLMFAPEGPFPDCFSNCKSLRTLTTFDSKITTIGSELILHLKFLRTLNLSNNYLKKIPKEIGKLIHLRYLDLSCNNDLEYLPNSMCDLYNLQTLLLVGCYRLAKLPESVGKLINLKYLCVRNCCSLNLKGIGRLTSLQTLDQFQVNDDAHEDGLKFEELKNLNQLQGRLAIIVHLEHSRKDASKAEKVQLVNKIHILHLELFFSCEMYCKQHVCHSTPASECLRAPNRKKDEEVLNALQPHQDLESLYIKRNEGTTLSTSWLMSLHNLRKLHFTFCYFCEFLPPLGNLPSLESLKIEYMDSVKKVGVEFLGIGMQASSTCILFPKLKQLTFNSLRNWEEWEGVEDDCQNLTIMPSLSSLVLVECYWLNSLPNFLWKTPLQNLEIDSRRMYWPNISYIPNIQIGCVVVQKDGVLIEQDYAVDDEDDNEIQYENGSKDDHETGCELLSSGSSLSGRTSLEVISSGVSQGRSADFTKEAASSGSRPK